MPLIEIVTGTTLIVILSVLAVRFRAIDVPGTATGALISFATLLAGGLSWLAVIISFVLISSLLTRYRYDYKQRIGSAQEKGGQRSWQNTLANGIVGGVAAILELATHQEIYTIVYVSSIAGAMSDTIATEIGLLSNSQPRLITSFRRVVMQGTSGAVSALGEVAGLVSAIGLSGMALLLGAVSGSNVHLTFAFLSVVVGAFLGMNFDSLLGATLQGKNRCKVCGKPTENLVHHGEPTTSESGIRYLENNLVNLFSTMAAALIAVAIFLVLIS